MPLLALYLRLHLEIVFAVRRLHPGNSTNSIKHQSILDFDPINYTLSIMYTWWSRRVPPPGPECRLNCFNVTLYLYTKHKRMSRLYLMEMSNPLVDFY